VSDQDDFERAVAALRWLEERVANADAGSRASLVDDERGHCTLTVAPYTRAEQSPGRKALGLAGVTFELTSIERARSEAPVSVGSVDVHPVFRDDLGGVALGVLGEGSGDGLHWFLGDRFAPPRGRPPASRRLSL